MGSQKLQEEFDEALALHKQGSLPEAAGRYEAILNVHPDHVPSLCCLSLCRTLSGRLDEALPLGQRATALAADSAEAWHSLGGVQAASGDNQVAVESFRRMLAIRPSFAEGHYNLGSALMALNRPEEAALAFAEAARFKPDYALALNNLGMALQALDRAEEAAGFYRRVVCLDPSDDVACNNRGIALLEAGQLDAARHAFETAVRLAPRRGSFYRMLADTVRITPDSPHGQVLEALAADLASLPEAERIELHFALGKIYADDGQHERSFRHLLAGNQLKRLSVSYDEAATLALFERIRAVFTAELLAGAATPRPSSPLPVFVIGMPRSGTTLVEQILASHPALFGAGELSDLRRLADEVGFPEKAAALSGAKLRDLGAAYRDRLRARAPSASGIIDKMPDNFRLLGLIALALPEARIIHVRRDPLDTCLSCFSRLFVGALPYAYDLEELGRYYRAYEELMTHWRQVLPAGMMQEVDYEQLVTDVETQTRRMIAHCGLEWDERCLAFHETRRSVRTASAAQVRQPLYASSVGRWHSYSELARPLITILKQ